MRRVLLLLATLVPLVSKALDLTPAPGFRELEGFKIPIVRFTDGEQKVVYQPPARWRIAGGGQILNLYPDDRTDVQLQLRVDATKPTAPNANENLDAWCRQFLPKDVTRTVCDGETVSPFTLRALPSREYTYTYAAHGFRFVTSVAVVDLTQRERVSVITTARAADFKAAHEEVIRSLFTMNWGR